MNLEALSHFLTAYLSVDQGANPIRALRTFNQKEGAPAVLRLRDDLKSLFLAGASDENVRDLFFTEGLIDIGNEPAKARKTLLDLFEHTQAVASTPVVAKPYDVFISH